MTTPQRDVPREPAAWMARHTTEAGNNLAALGFTLDEVRRAIPHGDHVPLYAAPAAAPAAPAPDAVHGPFDNMDDLIGALKAPAPDAPKGLTFAGEIDYWRTRCEQQARELAAAQRECRLLTHKVITCGVAATHPDPKLSERAKDYGGPWDSPQAQSVRELRARAERAERDLSAARAAIAALIAWWDDEITPMDMERERRVWTAARAAMGEK